MVFELCVGLVAKLLDCFVVYVMYVVGVCSHQDIASIQPEADLGDGELVVLDAGNVVVPGDDFI